METTSAQHQAFLEFVSENMICSSRSEQFMEWVCRYLTRYMKATHVSIALYDPTIDSYPVEVSTGQSRIPPHLVALNRTSSLVQWFEQGDASLSHFVRRSQRLLTCPDFRTEDDPFAGPILTEMHRHRIEVCAKIQTHTRLAGYLMIGGHNDGVPYRNEDLSLFQVLANNIAVEIEKEEYYDLSHLDPLTGLFNRNSLKPKIQEMIDLAEASGNEFAVALLDVDFFKRINDQHGHPAGDQVLRMTAESIRHDLRQSDLAFRYGGEEFLVLLPFHSRDPERMVESADFHANIYAVMERMQRKIGARPFLHLDKEIPITISVGICFYTPGMTKSADELIEEADQALYASKHNGRNLISVYPYI